MSAIDLGMDFQMPKNQSSQIKVMGIGGGGSNAVNYMFLNGSPFQVLKSLFCECE